MRVSDKRLHGLSKEVAPSDAFKRAVKARIRSRIEPIALTSIVSSTVPASDVRLSLRERFMRMIRPELAGSLSKTAGRTNLAPGASNALRSIILGRLQPIAVSPMFHGALKWAAAVTILILVIRAMPLLLMAPSSRADLGVQVVPLGEHVSIYSGGVWNGIAQPIVLESSAMIRTEEHGASVFLHDDGVLRIGPNSTVRIHDLSDLPRGEGKGPLITLLRGRLWVLGLVPPFVDGLSVEVSGAIAAINTGSVDLLRDEQSTQISVLDRSATILGGPDQTMFLVSGETVTVRESKALTASSVKKSAFSDPWVVSNLEQDSVQRGEIAAILRERRTSAGILPTSILYSAKRFAEEVDVLFTFSSDGRQEKRIEQANTRLKEAIALLQEGEGTLAEQPLTEYSASLIAMAGDQNDNLVKRTIQEQIADALLSLGSEEGQSAAANIDLLTRAVSAVGGAVPEADDLKPADIEGYILVDRLARINRSLRDSHDPEAAAFAYADIQPYLQSLLSDDSGVHPLLKKEAVSLLVTTSSLVEESSEQAENEEVLSSIAEDIAQYLPPEQEEIRATEAELNALVAEMVERIFLFRHPTSRYNQLVQEMGSVAGSPDRGTVLRRLRVQLPPDGLGGIVEAEIKKLSDELKASM